MSMSSNSILYEQTHNSYYSYITLNYQEYKTYQQANKAFGLSSRSYSMIENETGQDDGKVLGNTVIKDPVTNAEYELKAEYADDFTNDNPFIKVTVNGEKEYFINIDEINTRSASTIEMFALLSYANVHEKSMGFSSGIWGTLTKYIEDTGFLEKPYDEKQDWTSMVEETKNKYKDLGMYRQVVDGNQILGLLEQYGMPETIELFNLCNEHEHWLPVSNTHWWMVTSTLNGSIDFHNGEVYYWNSWNSEKGEPNIVWSMKITQEQLAKAVELRDVLTDAAKILEGFDIYVMDQSFWEKYLNSDMTADEAKGILEQMNKQSTYANFLDRFPDTVKEAWEKAGIEARTDGFGLFEDGKLLYLSEFARRYILANLKGESLDLLGKTAEGVLKFAKEALEQLEDSKQFAYDANLQKFKESEKLFYQNLISYME